MLRTSNEKLQDKFDHERSEIEEEKQHLINTEDTEEEMIQKTEELLEHIKELFHNPVQLWRTCDSDRRKLLFRVRS